MSCLKKKNVGRSYCANLPQLLAGMIKTPPSFKIPADTADVKVFLQDAIKADPAIRVYLFPTFVNVEDAKEDAVRQETPNADLDVRPGKYRWRVSMSADLCTHTAIQSHKGSGDRVIFFDINEQLFGTELSDGAFAGHLMSLFSPEKLQISDGSNATVTPVYVVLKGTKQIDDHGILIDGSFVNELIPLSDVEIKLIGSLTSTTIHASVKTVCDGVDILGLVAADFVLKKTDGTTQTITAVAYANGVYTITGTSFEAGTLNLVVPEDLSIDAYEASPVTV